MAMDSATWLAADRPDGMLAYLIYGPYPGKRFRGHYRRTIRRFRLFGAACLRHELNENDPEAVRRAVDLVECCADGARSPSAPKVRRRLDAARRDALPDRRWLYDAVRVMLRDYPEVALAAESVAYRLRLAGGGDAAPGRSLHQCRLLRDVFGDPFHDDVWDDEHLCPECGDKFFPQRPGWCVTCPCGHVFGLLRRSWLAWDGGTVPRLARAIYEDRRFQDLPVLADAAEDAGCNHADLIDHLRRPGAHVRGCWALDLLLGHTP